MTDYMAQPGLGLHPSSRQDIVSALLNDYGNSFSDGNGSPYKMSPVPAFKELPPPPPPERSRARDYSNNTASPAFQKMNTPFRLRVDVPALPESPSGSSSSDGSPAKIVSARLKRRSIPRSLTLTISNGSTAALPKAPTIASQPVLQDPFHTPVEDKALPPPPPEKSTRRQQSAMGNKSSTGRSPRKDSLHSQDDKDEMSPMRRKPLPKFTSLADLGNGPRGGKGGPMPQPRARKQSYEQDTEEDRSRMAREDAAEPVLHENAPPKLREQPSPMAAPRIINTLPPTPKDEPAPAPPPSSKKPFGGMGLPSNPKHRKGKSDTGFDALRSATSPSMQQHPASQTITPGPTPTPRKTEMMVKEETVDRTGLSPGTSNSHRRPFSFERVPTSPPPQLKDPADASINAPPAAAHPLPQAQPQPRQQQQQPPPSVAAAAAADPTPSPPRSLSPSPSQASNPPPAFALLPSQQLRHPPTMSEDLSAPPSPPPFIPLTAAPAPAPAPPITDKHHACYSRHATFVWSRNDFQPMSCMVCAKDDSERRWACVWCYLRICVECSVELQRTPGRRLQSVLEKRRVARADSGSEYDEEDGEAEAVLHPGFEGAGVNGDRLANGDGDVNGKRHDSGNANPRLVVWDADAEDAGERVGVA